MIIDWSNYDLKKAKELAARFGTAAMAQMVANIHDLDLVDRGILLESLKSTVRTKDGMVDRIEFAYAYYGKFHEVGADNAFGSGVNLRATHWRSMAISQNLEMLDQDFADYYASLIAESIELPSVTLNM